MQQLELFIFQSPAGAGELFLPRRGGGAPRVASGNGLMPGAQVSKIV